MALFKKFQGKKIGPKDKNWSKGTWYLWKQVNNKVIHKALSGVKTKEDAEKAAQKLIDAETNRRFGLGSNLTFAEFSETYLRFCEQENVNLNAKKQAIDLSKSYFKNRLMIEIGPQDCRDFRETLKKQKKKGGGLLSPSSVNRIMSSLSKMLSLACEEQILDRNPMEYVKRLKEPPKRKRLLTVDEKERLWEALTSDQLLNRLVTLALNLPLRRGQLLAITPNAIDWDNGQLLTIESKGRSSRLVPLNSTALTTLRMMNEEGQLPFPLKDFRKRWWRATRAAGINEKGGQRGENFTFHDIRKWYATELLKRKVNPKTIQHLFAHSDMSITDVYIQEDFDQMREASDVLDSEVIE